tara:strand:+ start:19327 stop:19722 length:396 start_codon:yes stop_codon:yes gene_type:complete
VSDITTNITIAENVTTITASTSEAVSLNINTDNTLVEARGTAIPLVSASGIVFTPYGTVTSTNLQTAIEQLADQDFRSTDTPTGTNVSEGDTWYDLDDNEIKVYREISAGVFAWTNLVVAEADDTLDAGAF